MGILTYEEIKEFLVIFAFDTIIILMTVAVISFIFDMVKYIVRKLRQRREKKKLAQDGTTEQA